MNSPSDFSLEVRGLPSTAGDGQLLALFDNLCQTKIFDDPQPYWEKDFGEKLNENYGLKKQKEVLLENSESGFDMKLAISVKKLDNSI